MSNLTTNRNVQLDQAYKYRYNRDVQVSNGSKVNKDGTIGQVTVEITSKKGAKYILNEYLKDNLTDYVTLTIGEKVHQYKTYLEAEVYVADLIGKEADSGNSK